MAAFDSYRFQPRISPRLVIGSVVTLGVIFLVLALLVTRGFDDARALRAEASRSYETRVALQHILSLHQDVETAQRGFQITRNRRFLQPHSSAIHEIDTAFARLDNTLLSHSPLRPRLAELHRLSGEKRRFVDQIIGLIEQGRHVEAAELVGSGRGKRIMDAFRIQVARMDAEERAQLIERTKRADAALLWLQRAILAVMAGLFMVIAIAVFLAVRSYRDGREALGRLEDSRARIAAILNGAKDGMIVLNPSGSIESLNPAAAKMYGYEEDELLRRDIGILFEVAPDRGQIETFLKRLEARRAGQPGEVQEFVAARRDGSVFPVEVAVSPVHLAGSTVFLAVIRDISERKQIQRMKDEFVSTVSHELRTPLTSIAGSLGLLTGGAGGEIPERALHLIEIARNNCTRLVRLINDILDIEKIESGQMRFDLKRVALAPFLEQAVQANSSYAAEYGVQVVLESVPTEAAVMADEDRLMQIMVNLLSNASKFSPAGEVVTVKVRALDRRYRISVVDHGPGISEGFRNRIFGKFAQEDSSNSRKKGGTGLGLSIVKEMASRMRGAISFESEVGKGTVFHVDLPAAPEMSAMRDEEFPLTSPSPAPGTGRPHVLHVDDDPDMLRVVAGAFAAEATVRSVRHLAEARSALARERFDAVILDIGMEDGSGLELAPQVRGNSPGTPIVVFTAQDVSAAQLGDVDAVLVKSRASLEKLVEDVLHLARAAKASEEES